MRRLVNIGATSCAARSGAVVHGDEACAAQSGAMVADGVPPSDARPGEHNRMGVAMSMMCCTGHRPIRPECLSLQLVAPDLPGAGGAKYGRTNRSKQLGMAES